MCNLLYHPQTLSFLSFLSYHILAILSANDKYYVALNLLTEFSHVSFKACDKVHHFCLRDFPSCLFYLAKAWKRTAFSQRISYISSKSYTVKFNKTAMLIHLESLRMQIISPFSSGFQELSSNFCKLIVLLGETIVSPDSLLYCLHPTCHGLPWWCCLAINCGICIPGNCPRIQITRWKLKLGQRFIYHKVPNPFSLKGIMITFFNSYSQRSWICFSSEGQLLE